MDARNEGLEIFWSSETSDGGEVSSSSLSSSTTVFYWCKEEIFPSLFLLYIKLVFLNESVISFDIFLKVKYFNYNIINCF